MAFKRSSGGRPAAHCMARLSWRSSSRLWRCRSVRPEQTGDRCGAGSIAKPCSVPDPPGAGEGQQDLRGTEIPEAVLGGDRARGHIVDDLGDLHLELGCYFREGGDPPDAAPRVSRSGPSGQVSARMLSHAANAAAGGSTGSRAACTSLSLAGNRTSE